MMLKKRKAFRINPNTFIKSVEKPCNAPSLFNNLEIQLLLDEIGFHYFYFYFLA